MSQLSQVTVLVTIVGVDGSSEVYYTYADPATGEQHVKSPTCSINAVSPFQTLFALDYPTTRNGWRIFGSATANTNPTTPLIPSYQPDGGLALITLDFTSLNYSFTLTFLNIFTGLKISDDPQEGNVLQPVKPGVN